MSTGTVSGTSSGSTGTSCPWMVSLIATYASRQNKLIEFAIVILSAAKDRGGNSRWIVRFAQNERRSNWSFCYDTAT